MIWSLFHILVQREGSGVDLPAHNSTAQANKEHAVMFLWKSCHNPRLKYGSLNTSFETIWDILQSCLKTRRCSKGESFVKTTTVLFRVRYKLSFYTPWEPHLTPRRTWKFGTRVGAWELRALLLPGAVGPPMTVVGALVIMALLWSWAPRYIHIMQTRRRRCRSSMSSLQDTSTRSRR